MSHIKVHDSHGYVPFSWEDKPGVLSKSKVIRNDDNCPVDIGLYVLNRTLPLHDHDAAGSSTLAPAAPAKIGVSNKKIPPPPPCPTPKRSISVKGLRWSQEDPFLAAYKECTKSGGFNGKLSSEGRKKDLMMKIRVKCSCKDSSESDVIRSDANLEIRLPNLPSLPKDRIRRRN